jgi:catechol 2,3-dioxygenase-like lactoylglutathione lyase family enzyme
MKLLKILCTVLLAIALSCTQQNQAISDRSNAFLGNRVQISVSVSNVEAAAEFYRNLGFKKMSGRASGDYPWELMTDGTIELMLSQNKFVSPALTYFAPDMEKRLQRLRHNGIEPNDVITREGKFSSAILITPNGLGMTLISFKSSNLPAPGMIPQSLLGPFGDVSIRAKNPEEVVPFWQKLGFKVVSRIVAPDTAIIMNDGLVNVGVYKNPDFERPALTFHGEQPDSLYLKLEKAGIQNLRRITTQNETVEKIYIYSPDGLLLRVEF